MTNRSLTSTTWRVGYQAGFRNHKSKYPNPVNAHEKDYAEGYIIGVGRRLGYIH